MMATDFPKKGDDLKISLRNSEYPQFDRGFAENIKEFNPEVWGAGGNVRGNDAFVLWGRAREGSETEGVLDWIKEREAWAARHFGDGEQFASGELEPNLSNVAGVIAQIKWGVIGNLGEQKMKDVVLELVKKLEGKKDRAIDDLTDTARKSLENKVEEHNEEHGDDPTKRATLGMLAESYLRGIGAYKTNPGSVRPGVTSPEQWAFARVNSLLFCLRNGRFQGGKHDTDLLPEGHPESTKGQDEERKMDEQRHIKNVTETDDSYIIEFGKSDMVEGDVEVDAENGYKPDDEERKAPVELETRKRSMHMDAEVDSEDDRRMSISISSEKAVERSFGVEILDHTDRSIDLSFLNSGNAPLLLDHDPERQIGVVESVNLDSSARRLRATVRFSKGQLGSEIYDDVRDGVRNNVSIGYQIGRMERDEKAEGGNTYRVRSWKPFEASIVSIPADDSVGTNRNAEIEQTPTPIPAEAERKEPTMSEQDIQAVEANARAEYAKTVNEILELGAAKNKRDLANQAIKGGLSVEQFRGMLAVASADEPIATPDNLDLNVQERQEYSLMRAFRNAAAGRDIGGFEREVSDEIAKRLGKDARGFFVPSDIFKRDLTVGTDSAGGFLKPTDHLGGEFVDALRPTLVTASLGARMMSGLSGDVAIPALNAKTAVGFVAENAAPGSEGAPTFRQITMSPKTVAQYVDLSRKLMMQSDPSVEQVIRDDMLRQFAAKIDEVAIEGGGSNEPTGITQTSGIGSVAIGTNGGALTYAKTVDLEKEVAIDNAMGGNMAFLTNPKVVASMRTISKQTSGVEGNFIMDPNGTVMGYNVASSNLVPSDLTKGTGTALSALIFGNFSELMIGMFGGLDVLVDPYTGSAAGTTRISMFQDVDVAVRHAESFAAILDLTT